MKLVDDEGRLFGLVNLVDFFVVLAIVAAAVTVAAFLVGGPSGQRSLGVELVAEQPSYVGDAVAQADGCDSGPTVVDAQRRPVDRENVSADLETLRVRLRLDDATKTEGRWRYRGRRVVIGGALVVDLCRVRLNGTVVDIEEMSGGRGP